MTSGRASTLAVGTAVAAFGLGVVVGPHLTGGARDRPRLRPVLNQGTNMDVAAEGFRDGEHFATLAHAARNTQVPFVLLKHRVSTQGKSLAVAIRESKPSIDAPVQADLAAAQARADIATIER